MCCIASIAPENTAFHYWITANSNGLWNCDCVRCFKVRDAPAQGAGCTGAAEPPRAGCGVSSLAEGVAKMVRFFAWWAEPAQAFSPRLGRRCGSELVASFRMPSTGRAGRRAWRCSGRVRVRKRDLQGEPLSVASLVRDGRAGQFSPRFNVCSGEPRPGLVLQCSAWPFVLQRLLPRLDFPGPYFVGLDVWQKEVVLVDVDSFLDSLVDFWVALSSYTVACVFLNVPSSPVVDHRTKTEKHPFKVAFRLPLLGKLLNLGRVKNRSSRLEMTELTDRQSTAGDGFVHFLCVPWLEPWAPKHAWQSLHGQERRAPSQVPEEESVGGQPFLGTWTSRSGQLWYQLPS